MNDINEGLAKLAEDLRKTAPPRYCAAHKPCDAREHQQGHMAAYAVFTAVFGSLVYGMVLMFGVNLVLAEWLGIVSPIEYWTSVVGTASLYALRQISRL